MDPEAQRRSERIEALIEEVSAFTNVHARETAEELMQLLLDMYGEGLSRILDLTLEAKEAGVPLIKTFTNDELVGSLLLIHDLHPVELETRIARALDEVRPKLMLHGGSVELTQVEGGVAHLRLEGSCHGCPASTVTLKNLIEEELYKAAPDLEGLEVDGVVGEPGVAVNTANPAGITCGVPVKFVPLTRKSDKGDKDNDGQLLTPGKRSKGSK
jgi:Fe-S cluster biogenesis protein NfuA